MESRHSPERYRVARASSVAPSKRANNEGGNVEGAFMSVLRLPPSQRRRFASACVLVDSVFFCWARHARCRVVGRSQTPALSGMSPREKATDESRNLCPMDPPPPLAIFIGKKGRLQYRFVVRRRPRRRTSGRSTRRRWMMWGGGRRGGPSPEVAEAGKVYAA